MQDNSAISKSTDKIKILNANFKGLESDVEVGKKINDILVKQAAFLKCKCWKNTLYSRREYREIIGILSSIVHSDFCC